MLTNSGIQQRIGYGSNFNKISIIGEVLIKQSMNSYGHQKMENEIAFYEFLSEVKRAEPLCGSERFLDSFPRIGSANSETNENNIDFHVPEIFHIDSTNHTIEMRYLNEHIPLYKIFFDMSEDRKQSILQKIYENLAKLHCHQTQVSQYVYWKDLYRETVHKIESRLESMEHLIRKYKHVTSVNGLLLKSLEEIVTIVNSRVKEHVCQQTEYIYSLIHGDCQFNNILTDDNDKIVFIDPRGYYGDTKLYGLKENDYAKIMFALSGYDVFDNSKIDDVCIDGHNMIISDFLQPMSSLSPIVTTLFACIWLGNAHIFIKNETKCITSYFIAMYYASKYLCV